MYTDLFLALLDAQNPRGHPILAALLYAYCPAAARWWIAGADPVLPFCPEWQALHDLAGGDETLKDALIRYGFEGLVTHAKEYIDAVERYRKHNDHAIAPELSPLFRGARIDITMRHIYQQAIENMGGGWCLVKWCKFISCGQA